MLKKHLGSRLAAPLPRCAAFLLVGVFAIGMAWLFHEPLLTYRLHSDDFEYLSASRTWERAMSNLFVAHNTHIVPAWRVLTWGIMAIAGKLARLQVTLGCVTFGALLAVTFAVGVLVARESGRAWLGLSALIATGTTSVMKSSATWYSSGQTCWAVLMIVLMLICLQGWRLQGGWPRLVLAALLAWAAGAFWTIGHAAGPTGAVYLWFDGRLRSRLASAVPFLASVVSIALALFLGGGHIDSRVSFHGRTEREALNFVAGATHTLQAIQENLIARNLGLETETTVLQAALLTGLLAAIWLWSWQRWGRPKSLEWAGATLVVSAYFVEWSFRGYLPFSSLRGIVPWYDTIPHVGAVLFGCAWIARALGQPCAPDELREVKRLRIGEAFALLVFQVLLLTIHAPRVEQIYTTDVPRMSESEERSFPTRALQLMRSRVLAKQIADEQLLNLRDLDTATAIARRLGIGRDAISQTFGRIDVLELPEVYDGVGLLDLPRTGTLNDTTRIRAALGRFFGPRVMPELPGWLIRN